MKNQTISTKEAPQAIGPYSQAVSAGGFLYISGQLPMDPVSGEINSGSVKEQTKQSMDNLMSILRECKLDANNLVKTTIYIKDMDDFQKINEVYGQYFGAYAPARACIEASRLPKDVLVEIDGIAKES